MTSIATKGGTVIVKDGKAAEGCGCCGGWYCWSCDCGLSSVSLTITDFRSFEQSLFNPSINGTYTMSHPQGVDACCEMWVVDIPGGITVTLYQNWSDDVPTLPTILLSGQGISGGGTVLTGTPCTVRDGAYSSPATVTGDYSDPSNSMNVAGFSFKASVSGVS